MEKVAILVGGGPAPGINGVIAAATIRAERAGKTVIGIRDGFQWLMQGDVTRVEPLTSGAVADLHGRGGSVLGTSRANPTTKPELLERVVASLAALGTSELVTIGGDDTAYSAMSVERQAAGRLRVVHVPKTIDNDLDLPAHIDTFGYQTARHVGVGIVKSLLADAETTSRWYLVVAMGRTAGHLAMGIGNAAGVTVTLVGEEFRPPIRFRTLVDTLAGAIAKRQAAGLSHGVAVVAEGIALKIDPQDFSVFGNVERDAHGNVRLAEVNLAEVLKRQLTERLRAIGLKTPVTEKNIGYELRSVDPIPFDVEYSRALGASAAEFLIEGGTGALISIQEGRPVPIPFANLLDPATGRTKVRLLDVNAPRYRIARHFMTRLEAEDFQHADRLAAIAKATSLSASEFAAEFAHVIA
jgi:6-phosphofructokinase 1